MQFSGIQTDVAFANPEQNLRTLRAQLAAEAKQGSEVVVFPECFLSGYCFESLEEAREVAEPIDGYSVSQVIEWCRELQVGCVFGMLEHSRDSVFNTVLLVNGAGIVGHYRKVHLPFLGVDRFTTPGEFPFEPVEFEGIRIGLLICYDGGFPEAPRVLTLKGADVVLLPTNWPPGAQGMAEYAVNCRAMENNIFFASINRIGTERGTEFIGFSRAAGVNGKTLDGLNHRQAGVIRWQVDPLLARQKRIVRVPETHVIDRIADRRPDFYSSICEPISLHGLHGQDS